MNAGLVFTAMLPEHLLLAGLVALLLIEIVYDEPKGELAVSLIAVGLAAIAAAWIGAQGSTLEPFPGQFVVTPAIAWAKAAVLLLAIPVLLIAREDFEGGPFYPLLLSSIYGILLIASSGSFLTLFLGIEIMSIPVYVLVLLAYRRPESAEAALKYLVLSGTASASLLMGASLVFGTTGSLSIAAFGTALGSEAILARTAVVMVIAALFVKAAVVPFHGWAPDAYEAASVPVTAYMATLVKAGVLLAALRLFGEVHVGPAHAALLALLPVVSIVWGNLAAMRQRNLRRMIAYSSIAHAGYLFLAFLGEGPGRFEAVMFYLAAYGVMNILAFAALPPDKDDEGRDSLETLKGLFHRNPFAALLIGMAMLSLAGIPPFPGFIGKFLIFKNVLAAGWTMVAVIGLVGSYLGIYFYLRVVQYMFMSPSAFHGPSPSRGLAVGASVLCLALSVAIALAPAWFLGRF